MPITLKRETSEYALHPPGGPYPAVLSEMRKHDGVETAFGTKDRLQLIFQTSELLCDHSEEDEDDRPMSISVFLNATLNDKGRLMTFIVQQVPADELRAHLSTGEVDVEALLVGTQWQLLIEHNEKDGRVYANVTNAMKAPFGQQMAIWREEGL
jgi:hypothetical protein